MTSTAPLRRSGPGDLRVLTGELLRYGLAGLSLNGVLYLAYLGLAHLGLPPLAAACIVYWAGLPLSYLVHGRISFARRGGERAWRIFVLVHLSGWLLNLGGLHALMQLGVPHQAAQAAMIVVTAGWLFVLGRWLVFRGAAYADGTH